MNRRTPSTRKPRKSRTALVPRIVFSTAIAAVVPTFIDGCGPMMGVADAGFTPDQSVVSLDASTFDRSMPDRGFISLDAATFDSTAPDHGDIEGGGTG